MDPMQLMMMQRMMQQRGQGMFGSPAQTGSIPALMAQNPQLGQQQGMPQPPMGQPAAQQGHSGHNGGFNPAFLMGLLPGLLAGGHLGSLAPLFGIGGLAAKHFGAFK